MNLSLLPQIDLASIEPTKFNIELMKQTIVSHFIETGDNPLEMLVKAEALQQLLDGIRADLREQVVSELEKHPQGKAEVLGAELAKFESGVKYIYDSDSEWQRLNAEVESKKYALKEREKMLRTITTAMVDPESGEFIHPAPKVSTTTFKITLKK